MTQKHKNLITKDITIKGHYNLVLKCGNKYNIKYGIHQGVHEYVGTTTEGEHLFKKGDKVTFGYYSKTSLTNLLTL
jgi:hypothetical protein